MARLYQIEVRVPRGADLKGGVPLVERLCSEEGLEKKVRTELRTYPGSTHWHYSRKPSSGTLEITMWPEGARIWLSVHENREGPWTRETARRLAKALEKGLGRHTS